MSSGCESVYRNWMRDISGAAGQTKSISGDVADGTCCAQAANSNKLTEQIRRPLEDNIVGTWVN